MNEETDIHTSNDVWHKWKK